MDKKGNNRLIQSLILAIVTTVSFLLQEKVKISSNYVHEIGVDFIVENINKRIILHEFDFMMFFFFCFLWYFYFRLLSRGIKYNCIYLMILSGIYALCMMMGYGFYYAGGWDFYFSGLNNILKGNFIFWGYYLLFYAILYCIEDFIRNCNLGGNGIGKGYDWFKRTVFILMAWIPYIILKYPGGINYDAVRQLDYYFGYTADGSGHPPFTTFVFGICVAIGRKILNVSFGLFLYNLLQAFLMAIAFAFMLHYLYEKGIRDTIVNIGTLCIGVIPIFPNYATTMVKDNLFSMGLMLYVIMTFEIINSDDIWMKKIRDNIVYFLSIFLMCTFRFNGIYIIIPTTFFIPIYFAIKKKNYKKNVVFVGCILGFICLINMANKDLFYKLIPGSTQDKNMESNIGSASGVLDLNMMSQVARVVCKYPYEISNEDRNNIDSIMDYSKIEEVYNPQYFGPIAYLSKSYTVEEKQKFISVWCKYLLKHPITYCEAILHKSYGFFYPGITNFWNYWNPQSSRITEDLQYVSPMILQEKLSKFSKIIDGVEKLPFIYIFENIGFSFWIILFCIFRIYSSKKYGYLICFIPILINTAIVILGPNFFSSPRYGYFLVYSAFPLLVLSIMVTKEKNNNYR